MYNDISTYQNTNEFFKSKYSKHLKMINELICENYINEKIIDKLSMFENTIIMGETLCIKQIIYDKNLYYNKKDFKNNIKDDKIDIYFTIKEIDEITCFISELDELSKQKALIYRIMIKSGKNTFAIYVGASDYLIKFIFKSDYDYSRYFSSFIYNNMYIIVKHFKNKNIYFIEYNKRIISNENDEFKDKFLNMIREHEKEVPYNKEFDKITKLKISEIFGEKNDSNEDKDINFQNIKIISEPLYPENNKQKFYIFIMNIKYYQKRYYNSVTYSIIEDDKKNILFIYFGINNKLFEYSIKNQASPKSFASCNPGFIFDE